MCHKHLSIVLVGILLAGPGCQKKTPPVISIALIPEPEPQPIPIPRPPVPEPLPLPPPPPEPTPAYFALEIGDRAFDAGAYDEAVRAYEEYLRLFPEGPPRDRILFRLSLILAGASPPDWTKVTFYLTQLTSEFPSSSLTPVASLILTLRSEVDLLSSDAQKREERIRQLTAELDRLKRIDAERQRRP